MTAVANAAFTAAQFNTYVRDNLNETAPAKATTAGRYFATTGANAIAERALGSASVVTTETTTSTTFTDLATVGPAVTVTTGPLALVLVASQLQNNTAGSAAIADFEISGATARSAVDSTSAYFQSDSANQPARICAPTVVTLTPGTNTFTMKYRAGGGTGTFLRRALTVIPF
jgi:hypothetical protein